MADSQETVVRHLQSINIWIEDRLLSTCYQYMDKRRSFKSTSNQYVDNGQLSTNTFYILLLRFVKTFTYA